jgi:hypothetical protein
MSRSTIRGMKLQSKNFVRKFCGAAEILSALTCCRSAQVLVQPSGIFFALKGMYIHSTQNAFYRQLFVLFSSYSFINSFDPIV